MIVLAEAVTPVGFASLLSEQASHGRRDAERDFGHAQIVKRLRCISRLVIVRIAQETGIRKHQRGIALVPERTVVAQPNLVDLFRQTDREQWHPPRASLEAAMKLPTQLP